MTAWIPFLLLSLPAWWITGRLRLARNGPEQAGLALLLGIGSGATLLMLWGMAGLPLTLTTAMALLAVASAAAVVLTKKRTSPKANSGHDAAARQVAREPWAPGELLLVLVIVALLAVAFWRADFYPVSAMDAHSYDGRARWITAEKTLKLSVYRDLAITGSGNLTYPPVYPLALAMSYWSGARQAKAADVLYMAGLLFIVYGVLRARVPRLGALFGVFLLAAAPEMWLHLSLGLTNVPATAWLAAGLLVAASRIDERRPATWFLSGLLLAFAAGVRSDTIVPAAFATVVLTFVLRRLGHPWREIGMRAVLLLGPAVLLTVSWQVWLRSSVGSSNAEVFRRSLLPDPALFADVTRAFVGLAANPGLYGWTLALPVLAILLILLGAARRGRPARTPAGHGSGIFLLLLLAMSVGLILLFQQIDPSFGGGSGSYLRNSLKRALFYLLPIAVVGGVAASPMRPIWLSIERWQRS